MSQLPSPKPLNRLSSLPAAALGRIRRFWSVPLAGLTLAVVIGTLAVGIVLTQQQSRSRILSNLGLRGMSSATFVSTFLTQQAARQRDVAQQFLAGPLVSAERFRLVVAAFGSRAAVLLDRNGRLLADFPSDPVLLGKPIAALYPHLTAAESGRVAVSDVVHSAVKGTPVAAVAVPFSTPHGRRVFSAAYGVSGSTLGAFVAHTISSPEHQVYLVDSAGHLVAASPRTGARSLGEADPSLARAVTRTSAGSIDGAKTPSTFTVAPVPGTSWRMIIALPDSRLYASVSGWTQLIPWLVLALVSVLGLLLVLLFARLTALSHRMAESARTDSLTGLFNRRALTEHLTRAAAHARRREEPMSVLMIDLDGFKQTNDRFGHAAGDQVLCAVAECMRGVLRAEDVFGRWGGDEFLVLMPSADEHDARVVAERLRSAAAQIAMDDLDLADGIPLSVGTATAVLTSRDEIVHAADLALYQAKSTQGRTRIASCDAGDPSLLSGA